MFRRLSEPLPLSEASLLALRPAMNAPVLDVNFLPAAPARAAIVVFAEEWGGIGLALGIRSNEGGQVAVFRNQESLEADVSIAAALEPALAHAERMGFLFDEDMVENGAADGRTRAMALWGRLMGEIDMPPAPRAAPAEPAATEPIVDRPAPTIQLDAVVQIPEMDLAEVADEAESEDLAEISLDSLDALDTLDSSETGSAKAPATPAAAPSATNAAAEGLPPARSASPTADSPARRAEDRMPPARRLSKFRATGRDADAEGPAGEADPSVTDAGSPLGRIPLVRVRRGREGSKRVPYLAKLLSSF